MFIRIFCKDYNEWFGKNICSILKYNLSNKFDREINFKSVRIEEYWKIPELTEIIVEVGLDNKKTVKDLIQVFGLKWLYRSSEYLNKKNELFFTENAIWDKKTHGGMFLSIENIVWVQIYTLDEE